MKTYHDLDKLLWELKPSEEKFLRTGRLSNSYNSMKYTMVNNKKRYIFDGYILPDESFAIRKHNRYAPVPEHVHNFIEISYVYYGHITQTIDGKKMTLGQGELCLIDTDVPHSIEKTGEDDIIINILMTKEYFRNELLMNSFSKGVITDFILNVVSETADHRQYILFKNKEFYLIHSTIREILMETFFPNIGSTEAVNHYLNILFIKLIRDFDYETNGQMDKQNTNILEILKYLDVHIDTITLSGLASQFSYTPNYLSTLLRKKTGSSYTELILEKKLNQAHTLLTTTSLTVQEAATRAGFNNPTFFYKKYKEKFHQFPSEREKHK